MRTEVAPTVIFTDLDGTLLSHLTYAAEGAAPVVKRLQADGVPVVFCSSKTIAEQLPIRRALGVTAHPFIVENGSAIVAPGNSGLAGADWEKSDQVKGAREKVLGLRLPEILAKLERVRRQTGEELRGYQQMSVSEIAATTGLDEAGAARAQDRGFSETIVDQLSEERWQTIFAAFAEEGLECSHGGRFHTLTGAGAHKGRAVELMRQRYIAAYGRQVRTIGLGDSANDAAMLAAVDVAFLIARPDGSWAKIDVPDIRRVNGIGPEGWAEAMEDWSASVSKPAGH